ncbi:MAG: glycosyltransferase [Verrucomicrobiae bacterium]|nr:glycosyltransferase [Verrucomicrobiae bacterium]
MKVLHIIAPVAFGGGESLLLTLINQKCADLDEEVVLLYHAPPFEEALDRNGIPHHVLRNASLGHGRPRWAVFLDIVPNLLHLPALIGLIRKKRPDLLHVHGFPGSLMVALASLFLRCPKLYTHHFYRQQPRRFERLVFECVYSRFDANTAVSNLAAQSMNQAFPGLKTPFRTVYNAFDPRFASPPPPDRTRWNLPQNVFTFIQVARFTPFKNHALIIEAVARLDQTERETLHIVFAGDGPLRGELVRRIEELGLVPHFTFLGLVPHETLPSLMACCDAALFPSDNEGFGIAAVECMACGLPVLALDNQLMREIIGPGGLLVCRTELHLGLTRMKRECALLKPMALERSALFRAPRIKSEYRDIYTRISPGGASGIPQS